MAAWEENVRKVVPYTPGEQPKSKNIIKLNTNENPYPPAPGVEKALREIDVNEFRKYPDAETKPLVDVLAEYYQVKPEQVFVGVGSDDVLAMSFMTFFNSKKPILFPDITYSFYDVWADVFRIPYECQPLDENFQIRVEDYKKECGGIVIPNPNAPTGVAMELSRVEEILQRNPDVIVIIDEAYVDFGADSALALLPKYENLLVVQTFSKSRSMAGMRIGYAIGAPKLIKYLNDVKYSFNSYTMNMPALTLGVEAVKDEAYFRETLQKVINTRERVKGELKELGFVFQDSKSNFIFASHPKYSAKELFEELKKAGIYVRYFNKPRIDNYLRISIGTDAEMDELIAFLKKYMK
ncbi:histidinol-phosphate transaminase [Roseburia sp. 499]|uniref:histidinol-phosphate transaminase n=1 Tax=Roseburia sp. 499 TaxID=1261634 RepID=UPI0009515250|nr:histidinol-phosphate transaminase [Roseburia sp. 499]WVK68927.1 histidinol-phosphate transaminase [Roseburia sp. 499]